MQLGRWLIAAIGAFALGYAALPAQAAPVGGVEALKASSANADVQQVHRRYRRYHYYDHHRYYRRHRPGVHFYLGPRRHHYRHRHWH